MHGAYSAMTGVSPMVYVAHYLTEPDQAAARRMAVTGYFEAIENGDYAAMADLLTPDAVTRWPQSGERITGALSCIRIYETYPGGAPKFRVNRVVGDGDVWVVELLSEYDGERWYSVSIVEFRGKLIARMTDYFGQAFPAPAWRSELVELERSS